MVDLSIVVCKRLPEGNLEKPHDFTNKTCEFIVILRGIWERNPAHPAGLFFVEDKWIDNMM